MYGEKPSLLEASVHSLRGILFRRTCLLIAAGFVPTTALSLYSGLLLVLCTQKEALKPTLPQLPFEEITLNCLEILLEGVQLDFQGQR